VKGLAIEAATSHVEVAVLEGAGVRAHLIEEVGHGHTRRLTPLVREALSRSGIEARELGWVAADLGPGSFTGVRVGLATARAFAFVAGAHRLGASSLAALAHASPARRALLVPLVGAGRLDVYAGFFRVGARGDVRLLAAPRVLRSDALGDAVAEALALVPDHAVRFVGPGVPREQERLERHWPSSTALAFRHDGLSALDLAHAARLEAGPGAGLVAPGAEPQPVYVRSAQAEERVRHTVSGETPIALRAMRADDVPALTALERGIFSDPWPEAFFRSLLEQPGTWARVAERSGEIAGYAVTVIRPSGADLENVATAPAHRRAGVARALVEDALAACRRERAGGITLEVRASNAPAQALYRAQGFGLAGLRPGYYRNPDEDALLMSRRV